MARRTHPQGHIPHAHLQRGAVSQRSTGWCSLMGCFIMGIFLLTGVFLYSMHYTVQLSSYFQQAAKLRRAEFPSFPTMHTQTTAKPTKEVESAESYDYANKASKGEDKASSGEKEAGATQIKTDIKTDKPAGKEEGYAYEEVASGDDSEQDQDDDADDDQEGYGADSEADDAEDASYADDDDDAAIVQKKEPVDGEDYGSVADDKESVKAKDEQEGKTIIDQGENSKKDDSAVTAVVPTGGDGKKKKGKKRDPFNFVVEIDPDWGVQGKWDLKYIKVMPTKKPMLKKDRRVVFANITHHISERATRAAPSGIPGAPRELAKANKILERHPLYQNKAFDKHEHSLEEVMYFVKNSPTCTKQPIFLTMATVGDDLYWQLIENFVYTLVKFEVSDCSLVICVSDLRCMKMCDEAKFPCFNYVSDETPLPSVMEQIAQVKLLHVPKALSRGVDVFMLDLDVGFLESPQHMVQAFIETPIVDIFVQEDYIFIMNRTQWVLHKEKTWFTEPLPNIGLFLCRGNNRTARVFELAWNKYLLMTDPYEKSLPGKDQNIVLDSMRIGRGTFGLKYAYFSIETAPLLDKLVLREGNTMELGGEAIQGYLDAKESIAMHTTCYEKSTKVMGLKASNAFWNPKYYDPLRRTITKQILYVSDEQLLDEVRSLVWLAITTDRSLILPNILGSEDLVTFQAYKGQVMWPGFRVTFLKRTKGRNDLKVQILEPAYYWRIDRDYDPIPEPTIVRFDPEENLVRVREAMEKVGDAPRVVLQADDAAFADAVKRQVAEEELRVWANDSVGLFPRPYSVLKRTYKRVPSVKSIKAVKGVALVQEVLQNMRNCNNIFGKLMGTRSCFQICD